MVENKFGEKNAFLIPGKQRYLKTEEKKKQSEN